MSAANVFGVSAIISLVIAILGFIVWCFCFFTIFNPYFETFEEGRCYVMHLQDHHAEYVSAVDEVVNYRQINLYLILGDKIYPAFACEAESNRFPTLERDSTAWFSFPYTRKNCLSWISEDALSDQASCTTGSQCILPRWLCSDWDEETKYPVNSVHDCKYLLIDSSEDLDSINLILSESNPDDYIPYITAIFDDSPYYSEAGYLWFMILVLGVFTLLPFTLMLLFILLRDFNRNKVCIKVCPCTLYIYRLMRKYICRCCCKYYDTLVVVEDRELLWMYCAVMNKRFQFHQNITKTIKEYIR